MLGRGVGAVSIGAVHAASGIGRDRLLRMYRSRGGLVAAVYVEGHRRVSALCAARRYPRMTAVDSVSACATALVEQAAADPVVRALHALEMSTTAADTGLPSIYRVLTAWMAHALTPRPDCSAGERTRIDEITSVVVAAVAGMSAPRAADSIPTHAATRARSRVLAALLSEFDDRHR
ncbi:hypothetical protein CH253_17575 [Rhodococcus sp. 06-156-3C]|nr:hypothetical protein CH280_06900 [Rhodococcus sp. 06-156-4C]OZD18875.1 hypothetical protein CH253_17575 [Rhodococcus sp. 06-156-3C]OZD22385.1 hypothetical protein CH248_09160 [Rhodococcus sp. 06-156-4a]OZD33969.1 hypothetical protein CH247_07690 [Rhodococcus sp. 06-156-3b]OZD38706.1 hypothetical protein CH284_06110 [Rhodococcus sp. 06-156-3]OZF57166.1 hypothetical protein CH290_26895 [Rhodococcus sp. 06-156-4]